MKAIFATLINKRVLKWARKIQYMQYQTTSSQFCLKHERKNSLIGKDFEYIKAMCKL